MALGRYQPRLEVISVHAPGAGLAKCAICLHRPKKPVFVNGKWVIECSWCTRRRANVSLPDVTDTWNGKPVCTKRRPA